MSNCTLTQAEYKRQKRALEYRRNRLALALEHVVEDRERVISEAYQLLCQVEYGRKTFEEKGSPLDHYAEWDRAKEAAVLLLKRLGADTDAALVNAKEVVANMGGKHEQG